MTTLNRTINSILLTAYGLGTILGAGIYVLVGRISAIAGIYAPFAFLMASIIALFTAISYAELAKRFPYSAGEAYYVRVGFKQNWLATLVGWLVVFTGIVSTGVLTKGFVGYFHFFFPHIANWLIILVFVITIGLIAIWGISQSVITSMVITIIESLGLIFIIVLAAPVFPKILVHLSDYIPKSDIHGWYSIFLAAFIAFYAFIGFEDIVNVAEEVRNPQKTIPIAIYSALGLATLLYVPVSFAAVASLPIPLLATSNAPLALLIQQHGFSPILITLVSFIAIINGALVQIIMSSRVIYGLAKQKGAPTFFARINSRTQTPILATIPVIIAILFFTYKLPLIELAKTTSYIILTIFLMVHLSLFFVLFRERRDKIAHPIALIFPIIGTILIVFFLMLQISNTFAGRIFF